MEGFKTLTVENAPDYEGKLLDSSRRLFHYYPLRVVRHRSLGWCIVDRLHTMQKIPEEGVIFDCVKEDET